MKPGADAYDRRGHVPRGAKVALGEDGVHDGVGADGREVGAVFVHHHGDVAAARYPERLLRRMREPAVTSSTRWLPPIIAPEKLTVRRMAVGRATSVMTTQKPLRRSLMAMPEAMVARAAVVYQHVTSPFWMLPQSAGRSSSAASALAAPSPPRRPG